MIFTVLLIAILEPSYLYIFNVPLIPTSNEASFQQQAKRPKAKGQDIYIYIYNHTLQLCKYNMLSTLVDHMVIHTLNLSILSINASWRVAI
jgi:hypothetical protein